MTKIEILKGIEEYQYSFKEKAYSPETKQLRQKYIQPILDIVSTMLARDNPNCLFSAAFFSDDLIKGRIALRIDGNYKEIDFAFLTKSIVDKNFK